MRNSVVAFFVSVLLSSCAGCPGAVPNTIVIRPGVSVVQVGEKANNPACRAQNTSDCPTFVAMIVSDVDRDGVRVAVLRVVNGEQAIIHLSEDLGATWKTTVVEKGLTADLLWDSQNIGVHLFGGQVFLLLSRSRIGAGGGAYVELWPLRVNLADGSVSEIGHQWPSIAFAEKRPNGRLRAIYVDGDPRSGETWPREIDWDPSTGQGDAIDRLGCTGSACRPSLMASGDNGATFEGYTPIGGVEICRVHWAEDQAAVNSYCVPRGQWPQPDTTQNAHLLFRGSTPFNTWDVGGEALAVSINDTQPATVSPAVPLGPGRVGAFIFGRLQTPRFGASLLLEQVDPPADGYATGRLVQLTPTGAQELVFRQTPCVDDRFCGYKGGSSFGYRLLQWLEPLPGGDYLAFWTVQSEERDNQQTLYVSHERPTLVEVTSSGPDAGTSQSPLPAYPEAKPMTAIEKGCTRQASCRQGQVSNDFYLCVAKWTQESDSAPGLAQARALFLATPGCGFSDTTCEQCRMLGGACEDRDGGGSTRCTTLSATPNYAACDQCDGNGNAQPCTSGPAGYTGQFQVHCADFGLTCNVDTTGPRGTCGRSPRCDPAAPWCQNGLFVGCVPETGSEVHYRCDLLGAECSTTRGVLCDDSVGAGRSACASSLALRCEGPVLIGCGSGRIHYVDCTELGFAGCSVDHCR